MIKRAVTQRVLFLLALIKSCKYPICLVIAISLLTFVKKVPREVFQVSYLGSVLFSILIYDLFERIYFYKVLFADDIRTFTRLKLIFDATDVV